MICIVAQTKEEILSGRFDISKFAGTSCGYWDKMRRVSISLGGRSAVRELVFPLSVPSNESKSATSLKAPSRCCPAICTFADRVRSAKCLAMNRTGR